MPIGMPGWPELAFWTASIASARIALAIRVVVCRGFMDAVSLRIEKRWRVRLALTGYFTRGRIRDLKWRPAQRSIVFHATFLLPSAAACRRHRRFARSGGPPP